jgi:hypothetical protein
VSDEISISTENIDKGIYVINVQVADKVIVTRLIVVD